ncbi:PucR C-terminal helix-turn-helix domain-containing protein [Plantibacter sp. VKM Ac-1784]|uniref:PucR C-terminal helix-turn-helix domain-containing protein n=1 Tax=Plantibacter elymi (nom. nud.) TaxID=199708 RepID=A0ABY1RHL0_9MICO|nr:PucR family transcriptional regulator [Plantibacter sp. VKM Ac-1784]SMQ71180.1 PucR C-terminal helix-turn-helix domain-containing protein [Plantibacter sp. VKM Ac-1784]
MTVALGKMLDELGPVALELIAGRIVASAPVVDVLYYDPLEPITTTESAILLCPGVAGTEALGELLTEASLSSVVAVIVRSAVTAPRDAVRLAVERGIAVFELADGYTWRHLIVSVHQILGDALTPDRITSGPAAEDLFALANAVAQMVGAPVTIEDLGSKILAFSDDQNRADEARKATVLARQVSQHNTDFLRSEGFFTRIYGRDEVVHVPTEGVGGTIPRAVVRLHHQGRTLGSIWAATAAGPSTDLHEALLQGAAMVAPRVAELAAGERAAQAGTAAQVLGLMRGGPTAREEAFKLGITRSRWVVVAIASQEPGAMDTAMREAALVFGSHIRGTFPKARSALVDGHLYAVVPLGKNGDVTVAATIKIFVKTWSAQALLAVIGDSVGDAADIPDSRRSADQALRALLLQPVRPRPAVPMLLLAAELQDAVLLQRLTDLMAAEHVQPMGPLERLIRYDTHHDTDLVATLRAWLDAFGDVSAAAVSLHVHANTFRYRLRRVAEIGEVDLGNSESRFSLMLQLRILQHSSTPE